MGRPDSEMMEMHSTPELMFNFLTDRHFLRVRYIIEVWVLSISVLDVGYYLTLGFNNSISTSSNEYYFHVARETSCDLGNNWCPNHIISAEHLSTP